MKKKVESSDRFVLISGSFSIDPIQPDPLPQHINYLQLYKLPGVEFQKIPVGDKLDKNCLTSHVYLYLGECGIHSGFVTKLVSDYNKNKSDETRGKLLKLVCIAREYAKSIGKDFDLDK